MIVGLPRRAGAGLPTSILALALGLCGQSAHAASLRYCDQAKELTATQQDRLLRFSALIKNELEASGQRLALISRSGLDLSRFRQRYSHAGISLKASANTPWSVRQLYYACEERRPKLYDQGMAGFVSGTDDAALGYVSVLLLPTAESEALERVALDNPQALRMLGEQYSANAYPFSALYQNCNQWVAELLALAWGATVADNSESVRPLSASPGVPSSGSSLGSSSEVSVKSPLRPDAQRWLQQQAYAPTRFEIGNRLWLWVANFLPWLHSDDHPPADIDALNIQVSMPASIESFVRAQVPGAERIEFCHREGQVVIHRGWDAVAEGCEPGVGDRVVMLN